MAKNLKEAAEILAVYPKENKVYFTEDGAAFVVDHHAKAHARSIGKPTIETVTREEAAGGAEDGSKTDNGGKYDALTVADLKEAIKGRQLEVGNAKIKADLIALLEADDKAAESAPQE